MTPPAPLPRESAKAFHAFQLYLTDPKRSRVSVGKKLGVSRQAIGKWADRFHWSERVKTAMIADTERAAKADELAKLNVAEERERERLKFQQRAVEASKRATERGLQILKQSAKGSKPSDAARLLAVGDMIGRAALELTPSGAGSFGLHPTITPVIKVVLRRDATSLRVKELEDKFFAEHPEIRRPKNGFEDATRLAAD